MKRVLWACIFLFFIHGCSADDHNMNRCLTLRERFLVTGCSFRVAVTADYGDSLFNFNMECIADAEGNLKFTVLAPEEISGIGGTVRAGKGKLEYEDLVLAFPLLADGEISPVSSPWILIQALRGGYLASCGKECDLLRLTVRDSYAEDALHLDVWLNESNEPVRAEILWQGRRVLSMELEEFRFV